ncbi:MAG: YbjN domain-containing protein [Nostoc sp.]|uniref:YbjN domain-containing protein n=1 Tax=Nostoc sp. TaxID=1180 RepID=UPI002FFB6FB1
MGKIFKTIQHFFQEEGWSMLPVEDKTALGTKLSGENGQWTCLALAKEDEDLFIFYSIYPLTVPLEKRTTVAEFLTRVNYGMLIGNFELDFEDGEVRYKTSINVREDRLSFVLAKHVIYTNIAMMDRYFPSLMQVIQGEDSPIEVVFTIEKDLC